MRKLNLKEKLTGLLAAVVMFCAVALKKAEPVLSEAAPYAYVTYRMFSKAGFDFEKIKKAVWHENVAGQ